MDFLSLRCAARESGIHDASAQKGINLVRRLRNRSKQAALAVALASMLWGCQKDSTDHLAAANAAIAAKDSSSAVLHLKNALARDPNSGETRLLLGAQELAVGDAGAAVIDLRRARELKVPDDKVVPTLAEALLASQQSRLLIEQFGTAKLGDPTAMARLNTTLALAYLSLGNPAQARSSAALALAIDATSKEAQLALARITLVDSDRNLALKAVDALLRQAPGFDEAWAFKGYLHELSPNEQQQALAAYAKAVEINPKQLQALYAPVFVHMARDDLKQARVALDALVKEWPKSFYTLYLQARMHHLTGNYAAARPLFATLLNALPDNVTGLLASGINELKLGAPIQAEAQLARAVSLSPTNTAARYYLAQANLQLGRPEKASIAIAPLLEAVDAPPEVLVVGAQAKLLQGDAQGADSLYTRAAKFNSKDVSVRTALALAQAAKGETDAAMRELQLISDSSETIDADLKLISTRLARNEVAEALLAIDKLEKKKPDQPAAAELRGQALLKRNDFEGARKAFSLALQREQAYAPALLQLTNLDLSQGKADQARKRLNAVLDANPRFAPALTMLAGVSLRSGGSASEVLSLLERATKADPLELNGWLMLMMRHFNAGDVQAALNASQSANVAIPDNVLLLEMTGRIQIKGGDIRQANSTYASLIRVAPRSALGYMGLAATLIAADELEAAAKTMQRLIDLDPRAVEPQRMAADIAVRRKMYKEALAIARNLQKQYPNDAVGWAVQGDVEASQGNWAAAAAALRGGLEKQNAAAMPLRLHVALLRDGKLPEARQLEVSWVKSHPKDVVFLAHLGDTSLAAKDWAAALGWYEQVLAIDPKNFGTLNNTAWVLLQTNDAKALDYAERALSEAPDRPEVLDTLAQIYASQQNYAKAIDSLKRAINRATNTAPLQLSLAQIYIQAKDRPNAINELEKLMALGKSSPYYLPARKLLTEQRKV